MDLDRIIGDHFSEEERDTATSGECGTFALALYRVLVERGYQSELVLLVEVDDDDNTVFLKCEPGQMSWRHCAVFFDDKFYDVDGNVDIEDCKFNYRWSDETLGDITLDEEDFVQQIACTQNDLSRRYYNIWHSRFLEIIPQNLSLAA